MIAIVIVIVITIIIVKANRKFAIDSCRTIKPQSADDNRQGRRTLVLNGFKTPKTLTCPRVKE